MPPRSPDFGFAQPADLAACREMIRAGSRTFFAASKLLPQHVREPAITLYAFCRLADDVIDRGGDSDALARLHERLDRVYDDRPLSFAVDRAFADTIARFAIPRALPEALLEGFAWDAAGRPYEDLASLYAYAARVAGTVGAMMSLLMGVRSPEVIARACDLGVAMQLTNIARDVGEDARAGRLYLPRQWLREAGIDPFVWQAKPVFSEALASVIERLLQTADGLYERAGLGIGRLPWNCRPGMHAARLLYAEIGRELERRGCDSISRRAVARPSRKAWLLARALLAAGLPERCRAASSLAETRFLVEAVAAAPLRSTEPIPAGTRRWSPRARALWLIDLFERLERRNRFARLADC